MEEPRRLGGRYELGHVLGRGGMAEVYLAHDTRLGRTVAVKTLRADLARDPSFQARFRREAQSAASLNHPAIVAVYDTGEDMVYDQALGGAGVSIPYIVMEYVDGSTLRELLHSGRKLLPERSLEMTIGILQALEYSHRSGIVHRDIKPANVMLTRTGQVKVMDFGIARAMGDAGMTMTQTSAVIGTAQYLSPEQAKGESVDARSDLYSTGCLLYELLTVRPPFVGDSPVAVAYQHVREEAQPPSVYDPEISPAMDAIVMKALVKDPDYRYQSADEMRADIEACLDGQPVSAAMGATSYGGYPDEAPTTMMRPQDAGGGGQTSMLPPTNPDDGSYGYDERPDRRRQKKSNASTVMLIIAGVLVLVGAVLIGKWVFSSSDQSNAPFPAPRFVGRSLSDAREVATNSELTLQVTKAACDDQPKNYVCRQDPAAGTKVKKHDTVTVTVSTGSPKVTVPDVRGLSFDKAKDQLNGRGFQDVRRVDKESDQTPGKVIDQKPSGDSEVAKSTTITLTVAKEKQQVTVPDVTSKTFDDAKATIEALGLKVQRQDVDNGSVQAGNVIQTSPVAGTPVDQDSTVVVQVAKAAAQATVPNLSGQTLGAAKQALQGAGLAVGTITGPQDDNAFVVTSDPGANQQVAPGTAINLTTVAGNAGQNGGQLGGQSFGGPSGISSRTYD